MVIPNCNQNIVSLTISISCIIIAGFALSFARYYETNLWFGNPLTYSQQHNDQSLISLHATQAVLWTITAAVQVALGALSKSADTSKLRTAHKFIGTYVLSVNIALFLGSAALILLNELIDGTAVHPTSIHLNLAACAFILVWTALGFYYIAIERQIQKHQDCMIAAYIASSVSALYRLIRYAFHLCYWLFISRQLCDDANVLPYIVLSGVCMAIISICLLWDRLDLGHPHNVLYVSGYAVTLAYPLWTMHVSFNPCEQVNIDYR